MPCWPDLEFEGAVADHNAIRQKPDPDIRFGPKACPNQIFIKSWVVLLARISRGLDVAFTTELTIDDHKDFLRVLGLSSRLRAVFLLTYLMILVVAPPYRFCLGRLGLPPGRDLAKPQVG